MNQLSNIFVIEGKSAIRGCDFASENLIVYVTDTDMNWIDLGTLKEVGTLTWGGDILPVGIQSIGNQKFAIQGKDGTVMIVEDQTITKTFRTRMSGFCQMAYCQSYKRGGHFFYVDQTSKQLVLTNVETGQIEHSHSVDTSIANVTCLLVHTDPLNPDTTRIFICAQGITIYHYTLVSGSLLVSNTTSVPVGSNNVILDLCFNVDKLYGIIRQRGVLVLDTVNNTYELVQPKMFDYRFILTTPDPVLVGPNLMKCTFDKIGTGNTVCKSQFKLANDAKSKYGMILVGYDNGLLTLTLQHQ